MSIRFTPADISIAIPTYQREQVLIDTLTYLLELDIRAGEILVVDQTPVHEDAVDQQLQHWDRAGLIRWLRPSEPSIPKAMNLALLEAAKPLVLFLDDDIIPGRDLINSHALAHQDDSIWAVVGQVLQPGQEPTDVPHPDRGSGLWRDLQFPFHSTRSTDVYNCMAGNLSVCRDKALAVGGFDENFLRVAYRFETEFARRLTKSGGRIIFEPSASIKHLQVGSGGTRVFGHHRVTYNADHSVGDYYFALRQGINLQTLWFICYRLFRELRTRHNLMRPWKIPLRLIAETRGLVWASLLCRQGPRYIHEQICDLV